LGSVKIGAIIGPSICGRCYEVSEEIFSEVTALHPTAQSRSLQEKPALDLHAALVQVLHQEKIAVADESACTVESSDLFSYRRDSITGRQAGLISL
jgi:copper oxidase (laccase) domain-containing protein